MFYIPVPAHAQAACQLDSATLNGDGTHCFVFSTVEVHVDTMEYFNKCNHRMLNFSLR